MMICSTIVIIVLSFVAKVSAKELGVHHSSDVQSLEGKLVNSLVDKIFDRVLKSWPLRDANVDQTTLGNPGPMALHSRMSLGSLLPLHSLSSSAPAPWVRPRPFSFLSRKVQQIPPLPPPSAQQPDCGLDDQRPFNELNVVVQEPGVASVVRSQSVTNAFGELVPLDRPMGKGTSIVIFLRHLG